MLSTNEKANIVLLIEANQLIYNIDAMRNGISKTSNQHLYITSNEKIKEGDYCIDAGELFGSYERTDTLIGPSYKIIATNDISLGLPQPSQQFIQKYIKEYNKGNVIANVLVEYEIETNVLFKVYESDPIKLKVNPKDNTITIKKVKELWNREEFIELINKFNNIMSNDQQLTQFGLDKWIEENL